MRKASRQSEWQLNRQLAIGNRQCFIVGLGNPGAEYEWSRHNLGFMLIDKLARDAGADVGRRECSSLVGRAVIEGCEVQLVKPQTFMNLSGEAVACLFAKHQADSARRKLDCDQRRSGFAFWQPSASGRGVRRVDTTG